MRNSNNLRKWLEPNWICHFVGCTWAGNISQSDFLLHSLLVVTHAVLWSPKFRKSMMKERWLHIISTFWLPHPHLSLRGVDRGEEKTEFWFLVALHSSENLVFLFFSIGISLPNYPFGLLVIPVSLVTVNILAVLLSLVYTTRMELFSGLPESSPNMPSFGPEVSINLTIWFDLIWFAY